MVNPLSRYVSENAQKAVKGDLHQFLLKHEKVAVEPKIDGIRVFLFSSEGKLLLGTKHNGVYSASDYPQLFSELSVKDNTILDGELVRKSQILYLFDVLFFEGRDIRRQKLANRLWTLSTAIKFTDHVRLNPCYFTSSSYENGIKQEFERKVQEGYEGLVVKDANARYGSPNSWLKLKKFDTIDCFVMAFKETDATKERGEIWSYSVGVYDLQSKMVPIGDVSSCVASVDRAKIKVGSVLEVSHQPTEGFSRLRHPTILRVRSDKIPQECSIDQLFGENA